MMSEILTYNQMCRREGRNLQKGMVFRSPPQHSVVLMCTRDSAPYPDEYDADGYRIRYVGHDPDKAQGKDQILIKPSGAFTENGKFYMAAMAALRGIADPVPVNVYQKLLPGIWCAVGTHLLTDAWEQIEHGRRVYVFTLEPQEPVQETEVPHTRSIPSWVRKAVYIRDRGRCAICGSTHNLHFDHIIPFVKGGSSVSPKNIQLLCAKHNLSKHDRIQ